MSTFPTKLPLKIERFTQVTWAVPRERLAGRLPSALTLDMIDLPGDGERALLSVFAGKVRLSLFGLPLVSFSQLNYQVHVRRGLESGVYVLRSLINSAPLAAAVRGAVGFPVHGGRLSVRWEPSGRAEIDAAEVGLAFQRERAPFRAPGFGSAEETWERLLRPRWGYWSRRYGRLGALRLSHLTPAPLSGNLDSVRLPWLYVEGLLRPEEAAFPHAVFFVSQLLMDVSLVWETQSIQRVQPMTVPA